MALSYRNTLKTHVVLVPEPVDILSAAEKESERLMRIGTAQARRDADRLMIKAQAAARHQKQTLAKMDDSRRWERYTAPPVPEPPPVVVPEPEVVETPAPVKAAKVAPKMVKADQGEA